MRKIILILINLILINSVYAIISIDVNEPKICYSNRNEVITGHWTFTENTKMTNVTIINQSVLNVNDTIWINGTDIFQLFSNFSTADETDPLSHHTGEDLNSLGYTGYFSFLGGNVGYLSMDGDPWYLSGTDLEIADNLIVDDYIASNLTPTPTLTRWLGTGANRWLWLYVSNISAENIDTFNIVASENISASHVIANGSELYSVNESDLKAIGLMQGNSTAWALDTNASTECASGEVLGGSTDGCIATSTFGDGAYNESYLTNGTHHNATKLYTNEIQPSTFGETIEMNITTINSSSNGVTLSVDGKQVWRVSAGAIGANMVDAQVNMNPDGGAFVLNFAPTVTGGGASVPVGGIKTVPKLAFNTGYNYKLVGIFNNPTHIDLESTNNVALFGVMNEYAGVSSNGTITYYGTRNNLGAINLLGIFEGKDPRATYKRYGTYIGGGNSIGQYDLFFTGTLANTEKYGIYLDNIDGGNYAGSGTTSFYDVYSNSGAKWDLHSDNQLFCMGASGCSDYNMSFTGSDTVLNTSGSVKIGNSSGWGIIEYGQAIDHTTPYDDSHGDALDNLPDFENQFNPDGTINHSALGSICAVDTIEPDKTRPVENITWVDTQLNETQIQEVLPFLPRDDMKYEDGKIYTKETIIEYPYTYVCEDCGIDVGCMNNLALKGLEEYRAAIDVKQYEGLSTPTLEGESAVFEEIYTKSKTIVDGIDYLDKFKDKTKLTDKAQHKNKVDTVDLSTGESKTFLNTEDRIVDMEGAINQLTEENDILKQQIADLTLRIEKLEAKQK